MARPFVAGELALRHQGIWRMPKPGDSYPHAHMLSTADSALIIPDHIRILRESIRRETGGIVINNTIYTHDTFQVSQTVTPRFLMQADSLLEGLRNAYIEVNHDAAANPAIMHNPLAPQAVANLDTYLAANPGNFSAQTAEAFLQPGGEDAFYVFKQIMHGIANTGPMSIGELLNHLRQTPIPNDLAVNLYNIPEFLGVMRGLMQGHNGRGIDPAKLVNVNGRFVLTESVRDLAAKYAPGNDQEVGPICPASVSRRHVLGKNTHLEPEFPGANATIDAQNLTVDVLEALVA